MKFRDKIHKQIFNLTPILLRKIGELLRRHILHLNEPVENVGVLLSRDQASHCHVLKPTPKIKAFQKVSPLGLLHPTIAKNKGK